MKRLLYLYPEEWTGRRAREVHTLSTCLALARAGVDVTLLTAGGEVELKRHAREIAGTDGAVPNLTLRALSRSLGPLRSAAIFAFHFTRWQRRQPKFHAAYIIHLKAAAMVRTAGIPYLYEAHEIFAETPQTSPEKQLKLSRLEQSVLVKAQVRIATSGPLAAGLAEYYGLKNDFAIVPNAGLPALAQSIAQPEGSLVYFGSIADWKGLHFALEAAHQEGVPVRVIGGTAEEWTRLSAGENWPQIYWQPRVPIGDMVSALRGARAGLIPTQTATPSGHYSCPMKLFDYARCGLPVISTALLSFASLEVGEWCVQVPEPTVEAWAEAIRNFTFQPAHSQAARAWADQHTWEQRAQKILPLVE